MSELIQKKIRISKKTLDGINQLIEDYDIDNESELYRQFIEIGFALKKKQLSGNVDSSISNLILNASKQMSYVVDMMEVVAKKTTDLDDRLLTEMKEYTSEYNHKVMACVEEFHPIDKKKIKEYIKNKSE